MEVAFVIQCNSKITVFKEGKETRLLLVYDYVLLSIIRLYYTMKININLNIKSIYLI